MSPRTRWIEKESSAESISRISLAPDVWLTRYGNRKHQENFVTHQLFKVNVIVQNVFGKGLCVVYSMY